MEAPPSRWLTLKHDSGSGSHANRLRRMSLESSEKLECHSTRWMRSKYRVTLNYAVTVTVVVVIIVLAVVVVVGCRYLVELWRSIETMKVPVVEVRNSVLHERFRLGE